MGQTLTPSHIKKVFDETLSSMPHEFSSKIFAKKTRELGLPKTSYVKNMRCDYLKKNSIRLNRFVYRKGFVHTVKYKFNNTPENKEFYDKISTERETTIGAVAAIIKKFNQKEIKMLANQLGWKILVKVETWNEL